MGMFDSLYDAAGHEWQTKAFARNLDTYAVGDRIAAPHTDFQVEIFSGDEHRDSYATVRNGTLVVIDDRRDARLPLLDYHGALIHTGKGA